MESVVCIFCAWVESQLCLKSEGGFGMGWKVLLMADALDAFSFYVTLVAQAVCRKTCGFGISDRS